MSLDVARVTRAYLKIRDARSQAKHEWEAHDKELKAKQEQLEGVLLKHLQDNKLDSARTEYGTFYRQEEIKPSCSDWNALWQWAKANDAMDVYEARVKKGFITEYLKEHDGGLPPGINVYREFVVRVRRA